MLQLMDKLQPSQEELAMLLRQNITNPTLWHLISSPQLINKVKLELQRIQQVPFFIRHVFKAVREPHPSQVAVLRQFECASQDEGSKQVVRYLLQGFDHKLSLEESLNKLQSHISDGNHKQIKLILYDLQQHHPSPLIKLLSFIQQFNQQGQWTRGAFKQQLALLLKSAFSILTNNQNLASIYLATVTHIMTKTIKEVEEAFSVLLVLLQCSGQYPHQIGEIIKRWSDVKTQGLCNKTFSQIIFKYFTHLFDTKLYFKQNWIEEVQPIIEISCQLYELMSGLPLQQLGWVAVLSMSKWIREVSEESVFKCVAFLRENYYHRQDIISQILVYSISKELNQQPFKFTLNYSFLMETLTPKQLKYLLLKLDQTLSQQTKNQIIDSACHQKDQHLTLLALLFISSSPQTQRGSSLKAEQLQLLAEINSEISDCRYSSFPKQIRVFKRRYQFCMASELRCLRVKDTLKFISMLHFFKQCFINDYFSEEYWINQQKMESFMRCQQDHREKMDLAVQFIEEHSIYNLSSVLLLLQLLKERISHQPTQPEMELLNRFTVLCLKILRDETFTSNLIIIFDFILLLSSLPLTTQIHQLILVFFTSSLPAKYIHRQSYTKIEYSIEAAILNLLSKLNRLHQLHQYDHYLTFYHQHHQYQQGPQQYAAKIITIYEHYQIQISNPSFRLKELTAYSCASKMINCKAQPKHLAQCVAKISNAFQFFSPLFKGEIVVLTHLSNSPQEQYYFTNHYLPFIYQQYAKVYSLAAAKVNDNVLNESIYDCAVALLKQILQGDTFSHGQQFYKSLSRSQLVYILLTNDNLKNLSPQQTQSIFTICLQIIKKDNYPLLRQYIQLIFCRAYIALNRANPKLNLRNQLMDEMKVNINIGVPIALTLGYELLSQQKKSEVDGIHEMFVKLISCHTAYLRGICQYYLYAYLALTSTKDQFLSNLKEFWKNDKDSQKIFTNISTVVQGFKEGVEQQPDFLGFERVEQYPSNQVKLKFYEHSAKFYSQFVLNQFNPNQYSSNKLLQALNQAATQRYQSLRNSYLKELELFERCPAERSLKSNMKKHSVEAVQEKSKMDKIQKDKKEENKGKKGKGKGKGKNENSPQQSNSIAYKIQAGKHTKMDQSYRSLASNMRLSAHLRSRNEPKIIIIATLLEKVHNFGHILRTLHNKNAMIVVPSVQPLLHEECKELVPKDCDVQVVQIRQRDLHKFITLMKSLAYPLVALEQCSRSVSVEVASFPNKLMMLLGNERIGAPASLLSEADLLVEIPQIGKIRSLNVHVSMVLCLWEFLNQE